MEIELERRWVVLAPRPRQNVAHIADAETGQILCLARMKRRRSDRELENHSLEGVCQNCIGKLAWIQQSRGIQGTPKLSREALARLRARRENERKRERYRLGTHLPHPKMFRPEAQDP